MLSGNGARIRHGLASPLLDVRLVPYLIPLLASDEVAEDIRMELRWKAPQTIGLLTDSLLDPDIPLLARQRIPSILEVTHNARAVEGLFAGLHDDVFKAMEREAAVDRAVWVARDIGLDADLPANMA